MSLTDALIASRIRRPGRACITDSIQSLGQQPLIHFKLWRLLRQLNPQDRHTRNLAALEAAAEGDARRRPLRGTTARMGNESRTGRQSSSTRCGAGSQAVVHLSLRCPKTSRDICTGKSGRAVAGDAALKRCGHDLFNPATAEREKCLRGSPHARAQPILCSGDGRRLQQVEGPADAGCVHSMRIRVGFRRGASDASRHGGGWRDCRRAETILDEAGMGARSSPQRARRSATTSRTYAPGLDLFVLTSLTWDLNRPCSMRWRAGCQWSPPRSRRQSELFEVGRRVEASAP